MATTKSATLTLMDATPRLRLERSIINAKSRVFADTVSVAAADFDADGDIVYVAEVPSNAKIISIKLFNDDLDSGTDTAPNVGIYNGATKFTDSNATSYAADGLIDEDAYASAITTLQAANTTGVEVAFEARNINAIDNYVWEDAGLPEDPGVNLRIALTQTATVAGAQLGDVTAVVEYVEE
jgi:hypothetical protein